VLNEDHGYIARPQDVHLIAGAGKALARLRSAGFAAVVVTNQSGIARGMFSEAELAAVNAELVEQVAGEGGALDAIYYCPHLEGASVRSYDCACACRKPSPGMLSAAASDLGVSLADSFMVGDTLSDIEAGRAVGCRTIAVGPNARAMAGDAFADDLGSAADIILGWSKDG